jgi:hypothetical protein
VEVLRSFLQPPRLYFVIAGALILTYYLHQRQKAAAQVPLPNVKANGKGRGKGRSYKTMPVTG